MACPICDKPTDAKYRPFCSKRCADVDLAKWLGGGYAIPSTDPEDAEKALDEVLRQTDLPPEKPH
ncbi:DNA gyrase inhibitor YacG [Octadecabacter sp. SW4]|uniref:DNA gyrase inhibitor YacG n=1 Tax=Octadecabacter sp. SW4 TaxID=2602067 RepID=UPI0011C20D56|nr:DNA gyrase inhibitor YacG [Octadecabacter sp. SW4]QEE34988.1 DNA gyrase inhibitor YacG [Octadecabacter sp. SW4]